MFELMAEQDFLSASCGIRQFKAMHSCLGQA